MISISIWFFLFFAALFALWCVLYKRIPVLEELFIWLAMATFIGFFVGMFYFPSAVLAYSQETEGVALSSTPIYSATLESDRFVILDDQGILWDKYMVYTVSETGKLERAYYSQSITPIVKDAANPRVDFTGNHYTCLEGPWWFELFYDCSDYDKHTGYELHVPETAILQSE